MDAFGVTTPNTAETPLQEMEAICEEILEGSHSIVRRFECGAAFHRNMPKATTGTVQPSIPMLLAALHLDTHRKTPLSETSHNTSQTYWQMMLQQLAFCKDKLDLYLHSLDNYRRAGRLLLVQQILASFHHSLCTSRSTALHEGTLSLVELHQCVYNYMTQIGRVFPSLRSLDNNCQEDSDSDSISTFVTTTTARKQIFPHPLMDAISPYSSMGPSANIDCVAQALMHNIESIVEGHKEYSSGTAQKLLRQLLTNWHHLKQHPSPTLALSSHPPQYISYSPGSSSGTSQSSVNSNYSGPSSRRVALTPASLFSTNPYNDSASRSHRASHIHRNMQSDDSVVVRTCLTSDSDSE